MDENELVRSTYQLAWELNEKLRLCHTHDIVTEIRTLSWDGESVVRGYQSINITCFKRLQNDSLYTRSETT